MCNMNYRLFFYSFDLDSNPPIWLAYLITGGPASNGPTALDQALKCSEPPWTLTASILTYLQRYLSSAPIHCNFTGTRIYSLLDDDDFMGLSIQQAIVSKGSRLVVLDLLSRLSEDPGDLEPSVNLNQFWVSRVKKTRYFVMFALFGRDDGHDVHCR